MIAIAAEVIQWLVWGLCILLILPVLLNVPGKPEPAELTAYFLVLATVTGYPALLPALTILERGTRRYGPWATNAIRIARQIAFCCVFAVLAWLGFVLFGPDPKQPVLTQAESFQNSYANAILWHDTGWMDRLMAEGASVDQPLSDGRTPAIMSAEFGDWSLVVFLLGRGADPDRSDDRGNSVRTLAAVPHRMTKDPAEIRALEDARSLLSDRPRP